MTESINPFTKAAVISVLVNNDFHYMHLLSSGKDFDKSHNLAQEYYDLIDDDVDYLMELALEVGAPIINYTKAGDLISDYTPESMTNYDYQTLIKHLSDKISVYISALKELRVYTDNESIQSRLDDMIRDWEKELNYRLARRIEPSVNNIFINTGLDSRVSESVNYRY